MAIRYAVAAGNFSDNATWDGGASLPASGDYVYANGYAVVLNVDINIGSGTLSTEICPTTSIGGGSFTYGENRNITVNIKAGSSHCVVSTALSAVESSILITGNVDGASVSACGVSQNISSTKNSKVTITGNITKYAVRYVRQSSSSRVYFSLTGNANSTGGYCLITNIASNAITFVDVTLTGSVTGNAYEFADPAAYATAGFGQLGTYKIAGGVIAQTALKVIYCATAIVTGFIENFGGKLAVDALTLFQFSPTYYKIQNAVGDDIVLMPSTTLENPPAESDVRDGVVYGIGDTYEGTLNVGATPAEFVAALEASSMGTKILAIPDDLATGDDVDDILTAISEITGTTPEQIVSYLLTQPVGKRMLICAVEKKIIGVERRSG